jgi:hypothetical protein
MKGKPGDPPGLLVGGSQLVWQLLDNETSNRICPITTKIMRRTGAARADLSKFFHRELRPTYLILSNKIFVFMGF